MATLTELPPELILHIVSFLTREIILDPKHRLHRRKTRYCDRRDHPKLLPDLPSINALSQTNVAFHRTLDQTLYSLCASVEHLGVLALLFAVEHGMEHAFDKLVAAGATCGLGFEITRTTVTRGDCCTLLHIAACMGHRIMVVKLLRMYRDGGMVAWVHNRSGSKKTALDYAVLNGHMEIVRLLAPIQMPSSDIHNRTSQSPTESDKQYLGSALIASAKAQPFSLEMSEYLIAEGADVNFIREDYCETVTSLYCAAGANLELVQFLLALGADPNLDRRSIPLFNASNADIAQALLDAGANLHAEDDCGRNALMANIMDPNTTDLVMFRFRFFVERGVDLNHADEFGQTPLHLACGIPLWKDSKIPQGKAWIELLLQFGAATVEKTDNDGDTPIDIAMNLDMTEIVKILEPLVQDPDLKLRVAAWWKRKLDEVEVPRPDTLI